MTPRPASAQLSGQIYEHLKADIAALRLKPGDPLQELELAARYGGSRTPVREALGRLLQEGLVMRAGRGYAVTTFAPEDVRQLYEIREALEKMAIRLAIERATDDQLSALVAEVDSHQPVIERGDVASFNHLDSAFHISIARISGNPLLEEAMQQLHDKVKIIRNRELSRHQGLLNAMADHRRILGAMLRRDIAIAEAEMRYHVRSVVALYYGYKEPRPPNPLTEVPLADLRPPDLLRHSDS
ncbi:MAG TPA: GntR family transcriptional regulator [Alphaproteobacteria bacterium]|nr:GntR family transcriptional regulator [Alphaproteobacteria bacterium]